MSAPFQQFDPFLSAADADAMLRIAESYRSFGTYADEATSKGPGGPRQSMPARHNAAILIDTDKVFHGVERVQPARADLPPISRRSHLHFCGDETWQLREGESVLADYCWADLRYSISCMAYCFENEAAAECWRSSSEDLSLDEILAVFEAELAGRGPLPKGRPEPTEFALLMAREFVHFPGQSEAA